MTGKQRTDLGDVPAGFESPLAAAVEERERKLLSEVADSVRHGNASLAFQPVTQARPPHLVAFYEGLIRVLDDSGRIVPVKQFIDTVESTEVGRRLDCLSLDLGLRTLAQNPNVRLALNMSARSIGYRAWMQTLERHLEADPTVGERLMLEISERSANSMPELVMDLMDRLQSCGIAFALDHFGADATVFRHLRDFCFDAVKIDAEFIRDIHKDPDNQAVTRALVKVAKEFDMLVIAQSVQSLLDANFLLGLEVDCLQGFLFGAPTLRPPWDRAAPGARERA